MKPKNHTTTILIIALVVLIIAFAGYFYYQQTHQRFRGNLNNPGNFTRRNLQLNDSQIAEVNSFFNNNPSPEDVQSYCANNRAHCFYYCRTLNPNNEICPQIMNFTRPSGGRPPQ